MRLARVFFPRGFAAVLLAAACIGAVGPAAAQGRDPSEPAAADARALEDARWQFTEGSAHYERGRYAEALAAFERSQAFVASPNTSLMIARCLREIGRGPEAAAAFERAEVDGRKRASLGETKYAATADAAKTENAQLRATLGTITIRVARAEGASVLVDGKAITVPATGEATVLHGAGTVSVVVRGARGGEQKQMVTVAKGASVTMDFAGAPGRADTGVVGPPPPPTASSWAVPAAVTAGVLTLAGVAVFTGFGLSSQSTYDDLAARCGASGCGPADRAQADTGARAQTIANVGLAVSAAAAVATVIFVVIAVGSGGSSGSSRARIPGWLGRVDFGGRAGI